MRVAIIWKQLSSQSATAFRALADAGAEVFLVHRRATPEAPYEGSPAEGLQGYSWAQTPDESTLVSDIERFRADALLVSSWDVGPYRRLSRRMARRTLRVLCMDNPWLGTPKQWAGRLVSPAVIRPAYDAVFVPDERQAAFARRLGFADDRIMWGLYSCDSDAFSRVPPLTSSPALGRERFLFVGRLSPEKGVASLAEAYRLYRPTTGHPWPLMVCGTGPLAHLLTGEPGVELTGFVQPSRLPEVFAGAACLILPSTFEPWGVVIHEAATAGLPVICSSACGAADRLVLDGYNGAIVAANDTASLTGAMTRLSTMDASRRAEMGRRGRVLAGQLTPGRWAEYLLERIGQLRAHVGLGEAR